MAVFITKRRRLKIQAEMSADEQAGGIYREISSREGRCVNHLQNKNGKTRRGARRSSTILGSKGARERGRRRTHRRGQAKVVDKQKKAAQARMETPIERQERGE